MFHEDRQREVDRQFGIHEQRQRFYAPPICEDLPAVPKQRLPFAAASEAAEESHQRQLNRIAGREIALKMGLRK